MVVYCRMLTTVSVCVWVFHRMQSKHCHYITSFAWEGVRDLNTSIVQALVFVRLRPLDLVAGPSPLAARLPTPVDDGPFITRPVLLLLLSVSVLRLTLLLLLVLPLRLSKKTLNLLLLLLLLLLPPLLRWRRWLLAPDDDGENNQPNLPGSATSPPPENGHHRPPSS